MLSGPTTIQVAGSAPNYRMSRNSSLRSGWNYVTLGGGRLLPLPLALAALPVACLLLFGPGVAGVGLRAGLLLLGQRRNVRRHLLDTRPRQFGEQRLGAWQIRHDAGDRVRGVWVAEARPQQVLVEDGIAQAFCDLVGGDAEGLHQRIDAGLEVDDRQQSDVVNPAIVVRPMAAARDAQPGPEGRAALGSPERIRDAALLALLRQAPDEGCLVEERRHCLTDGDLHRNALVGAEL